MVEYNWIGREYAKIGHIVAYLEPCVTLAYLESAIFRIYDDRQASECLIQYIARGHSTCSWVLIVR